MGLPLENIAICVMVLRHVTLGKDGLPKPKGQNLGLTAQHLFQAPNRVSNWNGTLRATADKSECVQGIFPVVGAEDCLYINVYTTKASINIFNLKQ
ncbi:hypothetical protein NQ318_010975 [Aromia moschata]|uniref:Carboxylesterase type B domain-containing protein n=1 Tax=Aromia moschata TaxID=1265417 RepID=A0AAV8YMA9_9CUCU|nr:hypothetical protein NQ318_010975 [Aromia moschata]